jgi:hypothetical protein
MMNSAFTDPWAPHPTYTGEWDLSMWPDPGARYDALYTHLSTFWPDVVVWETAPGLKGQALRWHCGYLAIAQQWAYLVGAEFLGVNVFTVKKWTCGKSNATKEVVHAAARTDRDRLGEIPTEMGPDALDAYLTLCWWWDHSALNRRAGTPTDGNTTSK